MKHILSFGEIIIDINNGVKTVGGAPLNFASHISLLGNRSYIYTALGDDENGKTAIRHLLKNGVSKKYILPSDAPTGTCLITEDSSLGYVISKNTSYDRIPVSDITESFDLLYFGTLAQRSPVSRATLKELLKMNFSHVYFDINIRGDFYSDEIIDFSLSSCTIYKASRDDIKALGYGGTLEDYCKQTAKKYKNIQIIIITLDSCGAMLYHTQSDTYIYKPAYPINFAASVGAGDGFSACFVHNFLNGKPLDLCLDRACYMGGYIASKLGAIPEYSTTLIEKIKD